VEVRVPHLKSGNGEEVKSGPGDYTAWWGGIIREKEGASPRRNGTGTTDKNLGRGKREPWPVAEPVGRG